MKKILSIALIATLSIVFSTGCGGNTPSNHDTKISSDALYIGKSNNETVISAIKKAGESTGWEITEFKSNELIAEKTDNANTISTSIKISKGYVEFDNEDASELKDALEQEMKKENKNHH